MAVSTLDIAVRNIFRNPRRTALTVLAVTFGIALITVMRGMQNGSFAQMISVAVRHGPGDIQLHEAGYWEDRDIQHAFPIASADTAWLDRQPGIAHVSPKLTVDALVGAGEERTTGAAIVGVIPSREAAMTVFRDSTVFGEKVMVAGRFLADGDSSGAVIGRTLATNLAAKVGDELVILTQGRDGSMAAAKLTVRGIFHIGEPDLDGATVFMNLGRLQDMLAAEGRATAIALTTTDVRSVERVARLMSDHYGVARVGAAPEHAGTGWEVMTYRELIPAIMQTISMKNASTALFLMLLLTVIAFGILNTILMSVMERYHELGVMMAIGMRPRNVAAMVFIEGLLLAIVGLVVGNALGWGVNAYWAGHPFVVQSLNQASQSFGMTAMLVAAPIPGEQLVWSAVILGLTLLVATWPAVVAMRFRPVEAIRQE